MLTACGFDRIEVASFVSPKWVARMMDGAEVLGVLYAALASNLKAARRRGRPGRRRWRSSPRPRRPSAGATSTARSPSRRVPTLRGYASCAADCRHERGIDPIAIGSVTESLFELGCRWGERRRRRRPGRARFGRADAAGVVRQPPDRLTDHFHDTGGRALDNIEVAARRRLRVLDAACGGLGGCAFAPGAAAMSPRNGLFRNWRRRASSPGSTPPRLEEAARFARRLRSAARILGGFPPIPAGDRPATGNEPVFAPEVELCY